MKVMRVVEGSGHCLQESYDNSHVHKTLLLRLERREVKKRQKIQ